MEISPITAVRLAPTYRPKKANHELTEVFEVESSSRADDESYSPGGDRAASGSEESEDTFEEPVESNLQDGPEPKSQAPDGAGQEISFFA
jgi:hypothetical protein